MTRPVVVSDSGPLIALAVCGHLKLLIAVFETIHIPQAVLEETTADRSRPGADDIAVFLQAHAEVHASRNDDTYTAAASHLDEGEAQALSLAHALGCGVLMDERRGREAAIRQSRPLFGVLGVLLQSKRLGKIERIAPLLDQMQTKGYRISQSLVDSVLKLAGESTGKTDQNPDPDAG
jgi:uncharacterized protein